MKAQTDSNSRGRKDFIYRKEKEKDCIVGNAGGTWKPVVPWIRVGIRFYSLFLCILPEGRDAFQMQMGISWGEEVYP
jgi:hypothetical protein